MNEGEDATTGRSDLDEVLGVLGRAGATEEPNEKIAELSVLDHGLQCAAILRRRRPVDTELQVAGLVHDLGDVLDPGREEDHGRVGAIFVRPVLGERVATLSSSGGPTRRRRTPARRRPGWRSG